MEEPGGKLALLFPGQGELDGTRLLAAYRHYPEVRAVFRDIDMITEAETGRRLSDLVADGRHPALADLNSEGRWAGQLAIFGASVAACRVLTAQGLHPDILAGHSLGEIAALVCGGALSLPDGAAAVWHRTAILEQTAAGAGQMAALGIGAVRATSLVDAVADPSLAVAADNHDTQAVVSGTHAAMDTLRAITVELGIPFRRLASDYPFHSPALQPAADRLAQALPVLPWTPPAIPVYSPVLQRCYGPAEDPAACLARHLTQPVQFRAALHELRGQGVATFIDCGTTGTLARLAAKNLAVSATRQLCAYDPGSPGQPPMAKTLSLLL